MTCPNCIRGMVVVLRTKGQVHPYRETSIFTHPERYMKKICCPLCKGTGLLNCSKDHEGMSGVRSVYDDVSSVVEQGFSIPT